MAATDVAAERPETPEEAAELLRALGSDGRFVRVRGSGTKAAWGAPGERVAVELQTGGLSRIREHNEGDFTAVVEAGLPFAEAQATFAQAGQMLALDPPLGTGDAATVGGVVAAADSGPLRHRYGAVRDLVVGMTVALSDGKLSSSGGRVIKNVAGYDLGKLFSGSLGTLGLIVSVSVRLHPRPQGSATAWASSGEPAALAAAAAALSPLPLEADSLDVGWDDGRGRLLVRFMGATAERQAQAVAERLSAAGLEDAQSTTDDTGLWDAQRDAQRSDTGAVLKVSALPADLGTVLAAARQAGAGVVARAGLGLSWVRLEGDDLAGRVGAVRAALAPRACTLLDAPDDVRATTPAWPDADPGALAVMRRVKERFDPARIFRPGAYVGGI
jgi:glycolate oxidase FAD binding subunit